MSPATTRRRRFRSTTCAATSPSRSRSPTRGTTRRTRSTGAIADHSIEGPDLIGVNLVSASNMTLVHDSATRMHEFNDTRYRRIEYQLKATTRFREYLPPAQLLTEDDRRRARADREAHHGQRPAGRALDPELGAAAGARRALRRADVRLDADAHEGRRGLELAARRRPARLSRSAVERDRLRRDAGGGAGARVVQAAIPTAGPWAGRTRTSSRSGATTRSGTRRSSRGSRRRDRASRWRGRAPIRPVRWLPPGAPADEIDQPHWTIRSSRSR